ncbi:transposase [Rhizohabitans arisaemae]|uniref:transposase n=1 Tax=Rhizohabitans arisaemae TaxID=2720610 RepID=UPI0024B22E77|nr:transposase [Rhizohabitans arisaemae]
MWVGPDGIEIKPVAGRAALRVLRYGRVLADCTNVDQIRTFVDLADLCEVVSLSEWRARRESRLREFSS